MRIDKLLANMGYGSRKEVNKLLKTGGVTVNQATVKTGKEHVKTDIDVVEIFGEVVEYKQYVYLMMNKARGFISATEDKNEPTVVDLLEEEDIIFEPFPVGRLDKDTEGLLLLTNDGKLSHKLLSPKKGVGKTYFARVSGMVTDVDVETFKTGIQLDDFLTKPASLEILTQGDISEIKVTIEEGKFHQVKRMFEAVDKEVTFLKRISMGGLKLDPELQPGEYRELSDKEYDYLVAITTKDTW